MSSRLSLRIPVDPLPWAFGAVLTALAVIATTTVVVWSSVADESRSVGVEGAVVLGDATAVQLAGATGQADGAVRAIAGSIGADPALLDEPDALLGKLAPFMDGQSAIAAITVVAADGSELEVDRREPGFVVRTTAADGTRDATLVDPSFAPVERPADSPGTPPAVEPDRSWMDDAWVASDVTWTDPEVAAHVDRTVVHTVMPARDAAGTAVAVVAVRVDASAFARALRASPAVTHGTAAVVGANGVVLAGDADLAATAATAATTDTGTATTDTGVTYTRAVADTLPWTLTVAIDPDEVLPAIGHLDRTMLVYAVIIVVVTIVMGLVLWVLRRPAGEVSVRARTDALTGLSNRHHFEVRGNDTLQAARRRGSHVLVAVFDLDNFKSVNDGAGHESGDTALCAVADGLVAASGPRDVLARLGGDEFACVAWLAAHDDPADVVERLRASAQRSLEDATDAEFDVGVSAGWADTSGGEYRLRALIRAADDAMVGGRRTSKGTAYEAAPA